MESTYTATPSSPCIKLASFKMSCLVIVLLNESLRHGLHHASGFHNEKVNCAAIRTFTTTQRKCEENHSKLSESNSKNDDPKANRNASYTVSLQMFHQLDKDVVGLNHKVDSVQEAIQSLNTGTKDLGKKLDSKFDCLFFLVVGGVVIETGFNLYINKRNWDRTHNEK